MLGQLLRSLFEIQILLGGLLIKWAGVICVNESDKELQRELMSPTASPFSKSISEYYFVKYVYKYDNSPMVNDRFYSPMINDIFFP